MWMKMGQHETPYMIENEFLPGKVALLIQERLNREMVPRDVTSKSSEDETIEL